jgi:hypothetical protein
VNVHTFEDKELGKGVPYGIYDVTANNRLEAARAPLSAGHI